MNTRRKVELLEKAYKEAQEWLAKVTEGKVPACGDAYEHTDYARKIVSEYETIFDDKKELPDYIFEFI